MLNPASSATTSFSPPTTGIRRCTKQSFLLNMVFIAVERCAQTESPLRRLLQAPSSKRPAPLPVAPWRAMSSSPLCCHQIGTCTSRRGSTISPCMCCIAGRRVKTCVSAITSRPERRSIARSSLPAPPCANLITKPWGGRTWRTCS